MLTYFNAQTVALRHSVAVEDHNLLTITRIKFNRIESLRSQLALRNGSETGCLLGALHCAAV